MSLPDISLSNELRGLYQAVFNNAKSIDDTKAQMKKFIENMKGERYAAIYETELTADMRKAIEDLEVSL